ncbi:dihydrolipoyl dehydrogenase family protein [Phreatobacter stygius]|uniref:Dihydrolipoamide dehydrogenase n=1 Tax=Phreatobacter stygius TaxID=1940610 RepID=A0A4D7AZ54_9HYPH|nr:FAD-dependent oxidoreductase [Phreatobacter stygius]QCI63938.1 dihydrolipoamide dehydrogenase [Phreatobacter stygius]
MPETLSPDVCVIGAGSGGLTVAAFCAMLGAPVVLVEKDRMGGDCLNAGCVPSKALIAAARRAHDIRQASGFGIRAGEPAIDFAQVMRHVRDAIATIAPNDSVARFSALGVKVIKGEARFLGPGAVTVGDTTIAARRFVIATGSRPLLPDIPGLDALPFLTSETIFDLAACPGHLGVLGGGPVGLEMAQAFRRLGAEVTVLERDRLLPGEDPEMVDVVRRQLQDEGIALLEGVELTRVEGEPGALRLIARRGDDDGAIGVSHLLVATGRRANVENLGLEAAGVAFTSAGITVDKTLRTSNPRIHAIGDVGGGPQLTHVAGWHGQMVAQNILFRRPVDTGGTAVPRVIYTDPELAQVGLTEAEARKLDPKARSLRWPFAENDRAVTARRRQGHIKLVISAKGRLLGASIVGAEATELIGLYALALAKGGTAAELAAIVLPYPGLSEVGKRAASTYLQARLGNPWIGRIMRLLRRFG